MAWFKVDDGFNNHRKVRELRRGAERLRAVGLWTLAGSYSSDEGLGGLIPESIIADWGATKKDVEALLRVGLWERVDGAAAAFHDWDHYQPDAATLAAQRVKESVSGSLGNHRRWHVKRGVAVPDCEFCHPVPDRDPDEDPDRVSIGSGIGSASGQVSGQHRPYPNPIPIGSNEPMFTSAIADAAPPRDDVERICTHLADRIEANGGKRPTITAKWRDAARLMLDRDQRTEADVIGAIDWCQADEFWRANILSLPKLREKYDQLRLQAQRRNGNSRQQETDDLFARAASRMGVTE